MVRHVLEAFAEEFLIDVPAIHRDGEYLIDHEVLIEHINTLDYDDLVNIMFEADARYTGE